MTATNDFLTFANGGGANVDSQASYSSDTLRTNGNQTGVAVSSFNNKAIRQANMVASQFAQYIANITNMNVADNTVTAQLLAQITAALTPLPSVFTSLTTSGGSGTFVLSYYLFVASANATVGATYTDSASTTFTVASTISGATLLLVTGLLAPAIGGAPGTLTKASGTGDASITYYATRVPRQLYIEMVGSGGSGASGNTSTANGTAGDATTFGSALLTAGGGAGGSSSGASSSGGAGSISSPAVGRVFPGGNGICAGVNNIHGAGGQGGTSIFAGTPSGGFENSAGANASQNTGCGGGGGGGGSTGSGSGGGGAAAAIKAYIPSPTGSYAYAIGATKTGAAGGNAGGSSGSGWIFIVESY